MGAGDAVAYGSLSCITSHLDLMSEPFAGSSRMPAPVTRPRAVVADAEILADHRAAMLEGLVLNGYTVPPWRGRGIARHIMDTIVAWATEAGIVRLVLTASPAGRPLYEKLGFEATREMAYAGPLAPGGAWTGA